MNDVLSKLRDWGCDVDGALGRVLDDEELLVDLLNRASADPTLNDLGVALRAGNIRLGFELAHSLKGVLGNLGITPMYLIASEMTETLRAGTDDGMLERFAELERCGERLREILAS